MEPLWSTLQPEGRPMVFQDRLQAGQELAKRLAVYRGQDVVVLALPRGGVAVATPIAKELDAPLDVIISRKIGHPMSPEYGVGAITENGHVVLNDREAATLDPMWLQSASQKELQKAKQARAMYVGDRPRLSVTGKIAILVDDGVATGHTLRAAIRDVKDQRPAKLIVAVPVAPPDTAAKLKDEVEELVVLHVPQWGFGAVGSYYEDFRPVEDETVRELLAEASSPIASFGNPTIGAPISKEIEIRVGGVSLAGSLQVPVAAKRLVIFAHGSGSSRHSKRNRFVASVLEESGLATLLFDLLTEYEDSDPSMRFDIDLLAQRLEGATRWSRERSELQQFPFGYFGASTGAAAALKAAANLPDEIGAIVSRGGRPDMAGNALPNVKAPTLLIVGSLDIEVIQLNEMAHEMLQSEKKLVIVPGASHLFEEPGTLEKVAVLARDWFLHHLKN